MATPSTYDLSQVRGFEDTVAGYLGSRGLGQYDPQRNAVVQQVGNLDSTFRSMFANMVGRQPTAEEAGQLFQQAIAPVISQVGINGPDSVQRLRDITNQFISDNFQGAAQDQAALDLQNQQVEANRLGDLFQTQGQQAINSTEQSLLDYQQRLFERLRPQLITSLQSQGLLNTGGLNQALAGQQADLANEAGRYVADLKLQNQQQANAIRFGGASAPYEFNQAQILNRVPNMMQQGQGALDRLFSRNTDDLNYQRQLGLMAVQSGMNRKSGGFFKQLGTSAAQALGTAIPSMIGQYGQYNQKTGQQGTGLMSMFV